MSNDRVNLVLSVQGISKNKKHGWKSKNVGFPDKAIYTDRCKSKSRDSAAIK